jgi:hypothetical protein
MMINGPDDMGAVLASVGALATAGAMRAVDTLELAGDDRKGGLTFGLAYALAMASVGAGLTDDQVIATVRQMLRKARP